MSIGWMHQGMDANFLPRWRFTSGVRAREMRHSLFFTKLKSTSQRKVGFCSLLSKRRKVVKSNEFYSQFSAVIVLCSW